MGLLKELNTVGRSANPLQILEIFPPKQYFSLQSRVKEEGEEGGEGEGEREIYIHFHVEMLLY